MKAKVVRKSEAVKKVKKLAALAEMVSYLSDTILAGKPKSSSLSPSLPLCLSSLSLTRLSSLNPNGGWRARSEPVLEDAAGSGGTTNEACLRAVQNMADFFTALNDVREEPGGLGHPKFLGVLGLVSALIGIRSKWVKK